MKAWASNVVRCRLFDGSSPAFPAVPVDPHGASGDLVASVGAPEAFPYTETVSADASLPVGSVTTHLVDILAGCRRGLSEAELADHFSQRFVGSTPDIPAALSDHPLVVSYPSHHGTKYFHTDHLSSESLRDAALAVSVILSHSAGISARGLVVEFDRLHGRSLMVANSGVVTAMDVLQDHGKIVCRDGVFHQAPQFDELHADVTVLPKAPPPLLRLHSRQSSAGVAETKQDHPVEPLMLSTPLPRSTVLPSPSKLAGAKCRVCQRPAGNTASPDRCPGHTTDASINVITARSIQVAYVGLDQYYKLIDDAVAKLPPTMAVVSSFPAQPSLTPVNVPAPAPSSPAPTESDESESEKFDESPPARVLAYPSRICCAKKPCKFASVSVGQKCKFGKSCTGCHCDPLPPQCMECGKSWVPPSSGVQVAPEVACACVRSGFVNPDTCAKCARVPCKEFDPRRGCPRGRACVGCHCFWCKPCAKPRCVNQASCHALAAGSCSFCHCPLV